MAQTSRPANFWIYLAACGAMVIGAFGPWATVLGGLVSRSGVDGGDGWFLVGGAAIAIALLLTGASRKKMIWAVVVGVICTIVAIVDLSDAKKIVDGAEGLVDVGWGLYLSLIASIAFSVQALRLARNPALATTPGGAAPPDPPPPEMPAV
jgi:hypothetical protein